MVPDIINSLYAPLRWSLSRLRGDIEVSLDLSGLPEHLYKSSVNYNNRL